MISLKTTKEIDIMDEANKIVHDVLNKLSSSIYVGMKTKELDHMTENLLLHYNATSAFKGYHGYPASVCISVNEEVVHGIPGERIICDGDIVTLDFGVKYKGFVGDAAKTVVVGNADEKVQKLSDHTKEALILGITQMKPGGRLNDIGNAISKVAYKNKYGNLVGFSGHGIGRSMHEDPSVFNFSLGNIVNVRLRTGMVFALEPMFTLGSSVGKITKDKWTVVTKDKSLSAHWEVSVAITDNGPRVLGIDIEDI